ncbi:hypothetical protein [Allocoleopsis sp.]|uniref:hypothetical protein n=1 Tax=Allocoleopsis sp. TaxID=3088169 RepID=UPI002FD68DAE
MPVSNVAIYTLAALTASALSDEANASPSLTLSTKELDADNFLVVRTTTPEPTKVKNAIAPPETLEAQPDTSVTATTMKHREGQRKRERVREFNPITSGVHSATLSRKLQPPHHLLSKAPVAISSSVKLSVFTADIFTPYLDQIRASLSPGLMMRLPSQMGERSNRDVLSSQYIVIASPSTFQSGLTVSLFSCQEQQPSCLVGSFEAAAKTSIEAQREFRKYQSKATPITLVNNIQGYLLDGKKQEKISELSSLMWEQDDQFYTVRIPTQSPKILMNLADSMASSIPFQSTQALPKVSSDNSITAVETFPEETQTLTKSVPTLEVSDNSVNAVNTNLIEQATSAPLVQASPDDIADTESSPRNDSGAASTAGFLQSRQPVLTTADQLRQGEVITNFRYRQSFPAGTAGSVGLTGQPTFGITWGVTNNLELTLDAQTVDNSGPVTQGSFNAQRINPDGTGPNFFQELTLQAKQRLWQNPEGTLALSGVAAASLGNASRPFRFFNSNGPVSNGENQGVVTSLELPFTIRTDDRWQFTLSPKVAFLPDDNALYFNTPPINNSGAFGTTLGLAGGISYQLNSKLMLWGDAFVPFTGNNTLNRNTGLPARTIAFNAGLRYLVNPRLATDLFVSNTLGNTGPLSIVADRDNLAFGLGVTYLPGITGANRRYSQHFGSTQQPPPSTPAGFALLDGGTIPNKQLLLSLQGGGQGLLTGFRYGLLDDLEIGAFLDSIPGNVDESELGLSGKIRFLHQADGDPFTLSGLVTVARANNVLINLVNNNRNELGKLGLEKGGFAFSNEKTGELLILTLSTPMHYQFKGGSAIWLTPTLGFVQRSGLEVAGLNFGGSVPLAKTLDVIAEAGLELSGKGNAFIGNKRDTVIPWNVGLRWRPASLLGISEKSAISGLQLEAYVTNRVGTTPFGSLRVRADNDIAIGAGLVLPIQF